MLSRSARSTLRTKEKFGRASDVAELDAMGLRLSMEYLDWLLWSAPESECVGENTPEADLPRLWPRPGANPDPAHLP